MTNKSSATKIYEELQGSPFYYTHTQIKHLFETMIGTDTIGFDSCMISKASSTRKLWDKPAELIVALSIRIGDFDTSSDVLFSECWKSYPEGEPDCPFYCAKIAAEKMSKVMELNRKQKDMLRNKMKRIKLAELKRVEKEWDDRMITSYLKLKQLI